MCHRSNPSTSRRDAWCELEQRGHSTIRSSNRDTERVFATRRVRARVYLLSARALCSLARRVFPELLESKRFRFRFRVSFCDAHTYAHATYAHTRLSNSPVFQGPGLRIEETPSFQLTAVVLTSESLARLNTARNSPRAR